MSARVIWNQNDSMANKSIFEPEYKKMIENLVKLRKTKVGSQRDLAKRMEVSPCCVGRLETRERRLDIIELIKILRICGLNNKEILKFIEQIL